jgi:hypothetical protein
MTPTKIRKISIAGFFCALVVTIVVTSREAMASALIGFSDFKEITPDLYFEPGIPPNEVAQLLVLYKEAKARISRTYGEYSAQPIIIFANAEKIRHYGNEYGVTRSLPWRTYVVIGPEGGNVDVIAHELAHAELVQRIGYWKRMTQIPAWFEEGMAMQVDYRKDFDFENFSKKVTINRNELWWQKQFNAGEIDEVVFNYALSKEIVRVWRLNHSHSRIYELLNEIKDGKSFNEAFATIGSKS